MTSGSKYETMAKAIEKKIEELNQGTEDLVTQKKLEQQLKRIDKETERKIKETKATPIDNDKIKQEAKSELNMKMTLAKREYNNVNYNLKTQLENLEMGYKRQKIEMEKQLKIQEEDGGNQRDYEIELAKQEYDRKMASINNIGDLLKLKIEELVEDAEKRKESIQIELDNVKAVNESKSEKMNCLDKLYEDIKEISLKLGDNSHTK